MYTILRLLLFCLQLKMFDVAGVIRLKRHRPIIDADVGQQRLRDDDDVLAVLTLFFFFPPARDMQRQWNLYIYSWMRLGRKLLVPRRGCIRTLPVTFLRLNVLGIFYRFMQILTPTSSLSLSVPLPFHVCLNGGIC